MGVAGFDLAALGAPPQPDDRVTVLFTIQDGANRRQWLGELREVALTAHEAKSTPSSGLGLLSFFQKSLKTDTGHEFSFPQSPTAIDLQTFGPFPGDGEEVRAHVVATREYLAQGLAPIAELGLRLRAAGREDPRVSYLFMGKYSPEQVAATKARAAAAGYTEDDERTFAYSLFALVQFANLSFRTDGIAPIVHELLDSPSLFSGGFVNLDWIHAELVPGEPWGLPGVRVFRIPYRFDSKTHCGGALWVTAPRPPLQTMAGILGLTIDWTSKAPGKHLIVRVLAGERGRP